VSFDLELLFGIAPAAPTVAITQPLNGTALTAPATFSTAASATDFDGVIADVRFFFDNAEVAADATEPYDTTSSNRLAGTHILHAVAMDDSGMSATSAPVTIQIHAPPVVVNLITNNSWWRVFDTGTEPSGAWFDRSYGDSGWRFGPGQFGWGETDEATRLEPVIGSPQTCYFRHSFNVPRASAFTNLLFQVLRDDGVVLYLNGQEVCRMNMPTGVVVTAETFALNPVGSTNESFYFPQYADASLLVDGLNTVAVELHQTGPTAADASFDLALTAIGPPESQAPLVLTIEREGAKTIVRWAAADAVLQETTDLGTGWTPVANATSPYEVPAPSPHQRFYRLRK